MSSAHRNATALLRSCNFSKVIDISVGVAETLLHACVCRLDNWCVNKLHKVNLWSSYL